MGTMRKVLGHNWKTTLAGVATIVMAVAYAIEMAIGKRTPDVSLIFGMVTAGWGLIVAKDANPTPG